jgi:pimeloyl-ACP methyl ester carboxylesterase
VADRERVDVPVEGGTLATFRLGTEGPPVLAVHGITSTSRSWLAVQRALGDRAALLAVDLRGRGGSNGLPPPYGIASHARDMVAVLDHFRLASAVIAGHSLGAYIAARVAADHPERVSMAVLVDGGLTIPGIESVDPQAFVEAFLGPALARLRMTFDSRQAYRAWWAAHPALSGSDVDPEILAAYADYDLVGEEPALRSGVTEESVRGDANDLFEMGKAAQRMNVPAMLLCAPRGLLNDPSPMQPLSLVREWAAASSDLRRAVAVPDVNHYTIVMGRAGARVVADAVAEALAVVQV